MKGLQCENYRWPVVVSREQLRPAWALSGDECERFVGGEIILGNYKQTM